MTATEQRGEAGGELPPDPHRIAILDGGSQYGGLIDRNVREAGYRTDILSLETPAAELADYDAVIISGGPSSVYAEDAPDCDPAIFELGKPTLGICLGMQLMTKHLGGTVAATALREDGPQETLFFGDSPLFNGLTGTVQKVLMSHGDSVVAPPRGFRVVGGADEMVSVIEHQDRRLYGVQFHPEVFQTDCGPQLFQNFLHDIAQLEPDYTAEDQEQESIEYIQQTVGDRDVVMFLSGGVDSTVLAALMARAIDDPSKIHAYHIDTGFMRQGESQTVMEALGAAGIEVKLLDVADMFAEATTVIDGVMTPPLNQAVNPQQKRKIIGDTFIRVRDTIIQELDLPEDSVLAQGSLRPDLIESGSHLASGKADTIKTHHNDTEEVRKLRQLGRVVEPLQALYKDQVRELGRRLGLPESLVVRHPFPGPGLAIRILCQAGVEVVSVPSETMQTAQAKLDSLLASEGFGEFQATVLPIRSVGVQGDGRSYKPCVSVTGPANWERLTALAELVPNRVHEVNRVCYSFTDGTELGEAEAVSVTPTTLDPDTSIAQARQADGIATEVFLQHGVLNNVSQLPVVLVPVSFGARGERSVVLRPFISPDFMTGIAGLPGRDLPEAPVFEVAQRIVNEVPGISRVMYDLSSKPPGTTEWE